MGVVLGTRPPPRRYWHFQKGHCITIEGDLDWADWRRVGPGPGLEARTQTQGCHFGGAGRRLDDAGAMAPALSRV